jgi:large subunit ribosomal protein L24
MNASRRDEVVVIRGNDKGKRGKVHACSDSGRVVVEGVNQVKRHLKPPRSAGGILEVEAPLPSRR